ncbi:transposase [Corallococcus macrosporus]|uniref:transposase n=1 Tax=Corallococcus macrosporus TaxID=35 RepID=UPI003D6D9BA2
MGRFRGGFSTKVHAVTTTGGKPLHIEVTPGQQHESTIAEELLVHAEGDAFIADTGYDAERIRTNAEKAGMTPVIHPTPAESSRLRWTAPSIGCATGCSASSTTSSAFALRLPATTRRRPATSPSSTSHPCFSGCVNQGQPLVFSKPYSPTTPTIHYDD